MDEAVADQDLHPVFCARDLTKLPPASLETGGSLMSLFEIISKQEKMIQDLYSTTTGPRTDVMALQRKETRSYASTAAAMIPGGQGHGAVSTVRKVPFHAMQQPSTSQNNDSQPANIQNDPQNENGADKFKVVSYARKSNRMALKRGAAARSDILAAGPTKFMVQLTNVNPDITEDDIKRYIQTHAEEVEPEEVKDTSSKDYHTKRFLVTFMIKDFDTVLSDTFWPERIYYKQWYPARPAPKKL